MIFDSYTLAVVFGIAIAGVIACIAWRRRDAPGALPLVACSLASAWWMICYAAHLAAPLSPQPLFWMKLMFAGVVLVPPSLFAFTLEYTGRAHWLNRRSIALLAIEPILVMLVLWSAAAGDLFFGRWNAQPGDAQFTGGIAFWMHTAYSYVLAGVSLALLIQGYLRAPRIYRRQVRMIIAGSLAPLFTNFLTIFHLSPFPSKDLTPLGFVVTGIVVAIALFRGGLLDLVPVARDAVVERMHDGVLVLDGLDRVVDINPAARAMLDLQQVHAIGQPAERVLAVWQGFSPGYLGTEDFHTEVRMGAELQVDVRITTLGNHGGRLTGHLVVLRDITALKSASTALHDANDRLRQQLVEIEAMQSLLREQAIRDPLTGLYNRRFLEETLVRELDQATRTRTALSVVIIDIDHFKRVNDTYGHGAGDRLLQAIGELLRSSSRGGDAVCRFGGEEFVAILPGTPALVALRRVEDWRLAFMAHRVIVGERELGTTFSAGVAAFPEHGEGTDALLHAADQALYAAKASGRNRVLIADVANTVTPP